MGLCTNRVLMHQPLAFQRMDGVRPASADLAIDKPRTAARLQRSTAEIEDNRNKGRTAFVTAGIPALPGGIRYV
jgi:glc operon protein GlcG